MAQRHDLDPVLVEAVVFTESNGKTNAFRYEPAFWDRYMRDKPEWDGANPQRVSASYGLMQVMFVTAIELAGMERTEPPEYLFVPLIGLEAGCRVLRERLTWAKGDVDAALAAYNGGKMGNAPGTAPLRNQAYVAKVHEWIGRITRGEVTA